jgi:hypothetical protein
MGRGRLAAEPRAVIELEGNKLRQQPQVRDLAEVRQSLRRFGVFKGYRDGLSEKPFDPDFGRPDDYAQIAYEEGRLLAAEARRLGIARPWCNPRQIAGDFVHMAHCVVQDVRRWRELYAAGKGAP